MPKDGKGSHRKVPLIPLPVMEEPFERIAMDVVGALPQSRRGHKYILVVYDYPQDTLKLWLFRKLKQDLWPTI